MRRRVRTVGLAFGLVACAGSESKDEPKETGRETASDSGDPDSARDTGDTAPDSGSDTAPDSGIDSGTDTTACSTTCDCDAGDLCYEGTCRASGEEALRYRFTLDRMVATMDPVTGSFDAESAYPTEALMTLASGAALLCDEAYADAAAARATFSRSWETTDHFLIWSGFPAISRDYQARHIYNLWAAGHALGDPTLRAAADDAAEAMLGLERVSYKGFTLFCTTYGATPPYACHNGSTWIDVNQNSEIGLAFALLAADPESALYADPRALDVVVQELGAAISMQDAATGAIPIGSEGGYEDDYDTLYGSYAAWSWSIAAAYTTSPDLAGPLSAASGWLAPMSDGDPESSRTYPYPYVGDISLSEGSMRIPLLSRTGALDPAFLKHYWDTIVAGNTETYSVWMPFWLDVHAGVPLADLLPPAD